MTIDYGATIAEIAQELAEKTNHGKVPSYIPELAKVDRNRFGICLTTIEGDRYMYGDSNVKFSIQSISKVLSLTMAISLQGQESLWKRVGVEPSGNPFNSIVQLEYENGIPRNPFINAGAIVIADILVSQLQHPKQEFLAYVRGLCNNPDINYNRQVAQSEKSVGYMNASLAYMMKDKGNLINEVDEVLDFYYLQCSLEMTCVELVDAFRNFGDTGVPFGHGAYFLTSSQARRVNALMMTCGFYDESGEFAFEVGLPGKSGVGGAIVALLPEKYCVSVWSPPLNKKGNSYMGMMALERLTTKIEGSIF
ncbi:MULTISPECIES: glutaminase [Reichenbachiella]|uniref:Glutaminase n=1 Tax=Reichenbachiella agariperforans TaxID=156994 RepID=A0A1M6VHU7_REIAG|nr:MULTISPECIES: glutaminase [Reichenbachiella]MBU2914907.1 glutaminase [Reichenbachiella agariperforans]SHK81040.1 L-glutaminase [Reichenbachiella agariperforans]